MQSETVPQDVLFEGPGHTGVTMPLTGEGGCRSAKCWTGSATSGAFSSSPRWSRETLRFNVLLRRIGDVSKQMLSRTLRRLEEDGFVERTVYAEVPPRVEYSLTDLGRSFLSRCRR